MIITVTLNTTLDKTLSARDFRIGAVHHTTLVKLTPAGKGINVSRVLAQLGIASKATGLVGAGDKMLFAQALGAETVSIADELVPSANPTRCNTTILDTTSGTETHVVEPGFEAPAPAKLALADRLRAIVAPGATVVFAGSLPPGFRPDELAPLIGRASESGARVWVDAKFDALEAAVEAEPDLVKPNDEELAWLTHKTVDTPRDAARAAEGILDRVGAVLVSLGERGAVFVSSCESLWACHKLDAEFVQNTVGCGDALLAGFLAGHERGLDNEAALKLAVACGSSSAMQPSAGMIDADDVERFAGEVAVEDLG